MASLSPTVLRCRINVLEWLLCDFKMLLVRQPALFHSVPSPFIACANRKWYAAIAERRTAMSLLCCQAVDEEVAARVSKRMCVYISLLENCMMLIQQDPQVYYDLPNPCDAAISKRTWETAMFNHRKKLRAARASVDADIERILLCHLDSIAAFCGQSMLLLRSLSSSFRKAKLDAQGGSVAIASACAGEEVLRIDVTNESTVLQIKQQAGIHFQHPPLGVVLLVDGICAPNHLTWSALGCPSTMLLILKPRTNDYAPSLFQACVDDDIEAVNGILEMGQDPNGWFWDAADKRFRPFLLCAITSRATASASLLLDAFANPNVPTADRRSALHLAVLLGQEGMTHALLERGANVHACDLHGQTPLHFAAWMEQDIVIQDLIAFGGNPLQHDHDCDVPLVCCEEPTTRAALMDGCWHKLSFCHILLLLLPALRAFLQKDQLRTLCRAVRRRDLFLESTDKLRFDDALGGSTVNVSSALNGEPLFCVDVDANDAPSLCSVVRTVGSRYTSSHSSPSMFFAKTYPRMVAGFWMRT